MSEKEAAPLPLTKEHEQTIELALKAHKIKLDDGIRNEFFGDIESCMGLWKELRIRPTLAGKKAVLDQLELVRGVLNGLSDSTRVILALSWQSTKSAEKMERMYPNPPVKLKESEGCFMMGDFAITIIIEAAEEALKTGGKFLGDKVHSA